MSKTRALTALVAAASVATACGPAGDDTATRGPEGVGAESPADATPSAMSGNRLVELWGAGQPAFGVYAPDERPRDAAREADGARPRARYTAEGAAALAAQPLYDFVFLNLEGAYDPDAVRTMAAGLADAPTALLVRIPPISEGGESVARARVAEILGAGADGVVLPHIRDAAEARTAIGFFQEAGADVWSPSNPGGSVVAMLMLEDPEAGAQAREIAGLGGFSVLACGIGSLTRALDGDRDAAEALNADVLDAARSAGLADMITAGTDDVGARVEQGFLALLMSGDQADEAIRIGREAAGR